MAGPLRFEFDVVGAKSIVDAIRSGVEEANDAAEGAVYRELTSILNKSKDIVPKDLGDLQRSGRSPRPERHGNRIEGFIGYGDTAIDYAVVQHETPPGVFSHDPGRSWKYLQRPFFEAAAGMGPRMAEYIRRRMERAGR